MRKHYERFWCVPFCNVLVRGASHIDFSIFTKRNVIVMFGVGVGGGGDVGAMMFLNSNMDTLKLQIIHKKHTTNQ